MRFKEVQVMPPVNIRFTHSRSKCEKWVAKFGGKADMKGRDAEEWCFVSNEGDVVFVVWMTPCVEYAASDDASLLAHEAVHVAEDYLRHEIGEAAPSEELKAYLVQYITAYLVKKHFKWKKRQLEKH